MKQATAFFVGVLGLLIGVTSVQAQTFFSATFSANEGYVDGPIMGQPANADLFWNNTNATVSVDTMKIENGALSVIGDGVGGKWIFIEYPVQQDTFTATFDVVYVGDGTMTNIGVSFSDTFNFELDGNTFPTYNEQGAMIRFAGNGVLDARNGDGAGGGSFSKLVSINYNDGVKLFFRAEIDAMGNFFSVYVRKDGEAEEVLVAEDYTFRRFNSEILNGLNCITIFDNNSDSSIPGVGLIIDNFVLYGPDGPSEPVRVSEWNLF